MSLYIESADRMLTSFQLETGISISVRKLPSIFAFAVLQIVFPDVSNNCMEPVAVFKHCEKFFVGTEITR